MHRFRYWIAALAALAAGLAVLQFPEGFVRSYLGDVVVVVFIYAAIKSLVDVAALKLAIGVLAFATLPEILQFFQIAERFHLTGAMRIAVGTTFDPLDFLAYAVGTAAIYLLDIMLLGRRASPASALHLPRWNSRR